ncbi:nonstructural protein 1 [Capuchin kidney parvovirus]|uniref:Nonstructural protein 1 n=1 Tax=Capuchin kidney parvovirus TaxID=2695302 RepID=A0A6B9L9A4_9VIRU|nr:nonstructural protein 1 [Capuchin kidney parvovirus]QHB35439.1 nonstructural protein 1 [Capuchin kidney parvovirus]
MQAQMERARRSLSTLRRYWWGGNACHELSEEGKILDTDTLKQVMLNWDSRIWQACVLGIWDTAPIRDPRPYCCLLNTVNSVKKWLICAEDDSNEQTHVHVLALTSQRSDAFKRTLEKTWPQIALVALQDIEEPDPVLEIVKCQKCHKPSSLLAYMTKDPHWIAANDLDTLQIFSSVYTYDWGQRFRDKQEIERSKKNDPTTSTMHTITAEITEIIMQHNCKSIEDCMKAAPSIIAKHLHRAGLGTIIQNCISWVTATGGGWSLPTIRSKYTPNPETVHKVLLHQGIPPSEFDHIFYEWITKQNTKKNTIVLWGPSNTGKSAFISGLKTCINWGEIVNSNTFAFEGLINTQLGIWEEPLISPELAEKAKQIFEGMETSIPVKYRKPIKLPRIPIIITTNHPPWRFCTKEEDMFRNRMYIFSWSHNMHETPFFCRTSEHSCQCRLCQTSRGSQTDTSGEPTSSMPGEKQPISELVQSQSTPSYVPTRSLSLSREETSLSTTETSGSDNERYRCSPTKQPLQRPDSPRPSCSSSTTTSDSIRSDREYRPGYSRTGISHTFPGIPEHLESSFTRGNNEYDSSGTRMGTPTNTNNTTGITDPPRLGGKRSHSEEMVVMGETENKKTRHSFPTTITSMGGDLGTLTIPTRLQWLAYLSYLQQQYG